MIKTIILLAIITLTNNCWSQTTIQYRGATFTRVETVRYIPNRVYLKPPHYVKKHRFTPQSTILIRQYPTYRPQTLLINSWGRSGVVFPMPHGGYWHY